MKSYKSYFGSFLIVGGLLLNAVPAHGFYGYHVSVGYSTTLNSKKDIRNLLLLLGGLTALGLFSIWVLNKIEESNNRPPAPRPSVPPAPVAKTLDQELKEMQEYRNYCANTYLFDGVYSQLNKITGQDWGTFSSDAQRKYADDMNEQMFVALSKEHFNARKPSVVEYQRKLAEDIIKLDHDIARMRELAVETSYATNLKSKLESLRRYITYRQPHLELSQQTDRIQQHSGAALELIAHGREADVTNSIRTQFPRTYARFEDYRKAVHDDAQTLPHTLDSVLRADRTVTPDLYNRAYVMNPHLQILDRIITQPKQQSA